MNKTHWLYLILQFFCQLPNLGFKCCIWFGAIQRHTLWNTWCKFDITNLIIPSTAKFKAYPKKNTYIILQILKRKQLTEKYSSCSLFFFYPFIFLHTWLARASHENGLIIQPTHWFYQLVQISSMDMCANVSKDVTVHFEIIPSLELEHWNVSYGGYYGLENIQWGWLWLYVLA